MFKKIGLSILILLVVSSYVYAGALATTLASSTHSKSNWSNVNKVTMTWTKPADDTGGYGAVKGYAIKWDTTATSNPGTSLSLDANATSTTSGALADGQSIYFHIRVIYENGSPFDWDDFGPFWIDATAPSKPTSFSITAGDQKLTLSWTNPGESDFAGTVITKSEKTGSACSYPTSAAVGYVATVKSDASPNYVDTASLTNDKTYCYSIFAYDQRGAETTRNYSSAAQANGTPKSSGGGSTYPYVLTNDPNSNATDVPTTTTVSIGFSKDMNSSTIADASGSSTTISVKETLAGTAVTGTYAYTASTKSVKFTPSSKLSYGKEYTVAVLGGTSGVKDSQNNQLGSEGDQGATTSNSYSFKFTTVAETQPDVSSISPADTSTNIALNQRIVATFTKSMNSNSITSSTFKVTSGSATGTAVSGTLSYNDLDKTATFTPSANYTGGAKIYITIVGGASGITDSSGLTLKSSSYSYSFTVVATPIIDLSSSKLDFGTVATNGTKDLTLTITNKGSQPLYFGTSSITGSYYSITTDNCKDKNFAQDVTCTIVVRFTPTADGNPHTATLSIPSNNGRTDTATSSTNTISLTGIATATPTASISIDKSNIDFGTVNVDASSSVTVTITSSGTFALEVGAFTFTKGNTGFSVPDATNNCKGTGASKSIAVGSTCTFVVVFNPTTEASSLTDTISIASNRGNTDATVNKSSAISVGGTGKKSAYVIYLKAGWNLISLPLQPTDTTTATVLSDIAGKFSIVWGDFNPTTQTWKYKNSSGGGLLSTMTAGKAYWVYVTDAAGATLNNTGDQVAHNITLKPGWNFVGFNKTASQTTSSALTGIGGNYSIVWGDFNPSTQTWKYKNSSGGGLLNNIETGKGYWIYNNTSSDINWSI
ncbi:MAG: Ig-like domain-containing protein [Deltaproteobacteria bacterium]